MSDPITLGSLGALFLVQAGKTVREAFRSRRMHRELLEEVREARIQASSATRKLERLTEHLQDKGLITPDPLRKRRVRSLMDPVTYLGPIPDPLDAEKPTNKGGKK